MKNVGKSTKGKRRAWVGTWERCIGHLGKKEIYHPMWKEVVFSTNGVGKKNKSYLHAIELRIWTLPHSIYEKLLKIDMDLNVKLKTIKILEIKAWENLYDVGLRRDYLDKHWKYNL